jgi:predicted RNase H-like HicB family nuclease
LGGYKLTAIIEREGSLFIARCVELDIASQGESGAAALSNLRDLATTFLKNIGEAEILERLVRDVAVAQFEIERP